MGETVTTTADYRAHLGRLTDPSTPKWLHSLRETSLDRFQRLGYPTAAQEDWRYTRPEPFSKPLPPAPPTARATRDDVRAHGYANLDAHELVFVNGIYQPTLSSLKPLPTGVRAQSLASTLAKTPEDAEHYLAQVADPDARAFTALNTALFADGAFLDIPAGLQLEKPIHLLFYADTGRDAALQFPRVLVHAGQNSKSNIIETYAGPGASAHTTLAVAEYVLEEAAQVHRHKVQREPTTATHLQVVELELGRDSQFTDHNVAFGANVSRTDLGARFQGQGGDLTLNGLYVLQGTQHADNHTFVDHNQPNCTSREFYKGILDGTSRGVFYGKVLVRAGAQKTNASQTNKNLLLSDGALVDSTPALEINADDVKCSHGSTIGQLDAESLFYLQSRGIDRGTARSLLTYAFARDVLGQIKLPAVRAALDELVLARLPSGRAVKEALGDAS